MIAESVTLMIANLYAEHGWPVFPLRGKLPFGNCPRCSSKSAAYVPHDKAACTCPLCHGYYAATCNTERIGGWWTRWPTANIGIPTGVPTGLVVLDEDPRHDGPATLKRLFAASDPPPAPTLEAITGSDGRHLLYAHPGGKIKSVDAAFGSDMPGLDVKADGGYFVACPSVHADTGRLYRWASDPFATPLAPWPDQWTRLMTRPEPPRAHLAKTTWSSSPGAAAAALRGACRVVVDAPEGQRNQCLNWAAYRMASRVAAGGLDPDDVEVALTDAGLSAGLTPAETAATIASGLRSSGAHR